MKKRSTFAMLLRRTWVPALGLVVMAFFGGYAVLGPNGVLAYGEYKRQLAIKSQQYKQLAEQRAEIKNRVKLLDPRHANPDLVDELTREKLNVVHPDEIIIPLN
jgi:cell division protein FtsB